MWVFCGGMQRSGSTLQFQLVAHLVEMAERGSRQEWVEPEQLVKVLADTTDGGSVLKVVKTHAFTEAIEAEFSAGRAMGFYTFRDIRDVVVSFMHKEAREFEEGWVRRRVERNLGWYMEWVRQPRVLISRYETIVQDLSAEVARIAAFLDISLSATDCAQVASQYTVERQRETIAKSVEEERLTQLPGAQFDPHSLLHTNHIHSGEVGGWRTQLTPDQIAFIEGVAGGWLTENGYALHTP